MYRNRLRWIGVLVLSIMVFAGCGRLSAEVISAAPEAGGGRPPITVAAEPGANIDMVAIRATADANLDGSAAEQVEQNSALAPVDETWNLYTNYKLGFAIILPRDITLFFGGCTFNEEQNSYRPAYASVPTTIFEHGDTAYLTFSHYAELQGLSLTELPNGGTRHDFSACATVTNTLDLVLDPDSHYKQMWAIQVVSIEDEAELTQFIQNRYGAGCAVGEMKATEQEGVYDVTIQGDGRHFTESTCPINYATVVKYDAIRQKVAAWDLGQAVTFAEDPGNLVTYDQQMVQSFRFID